MSMLDIASSDLTIVGAHSHSPRTSKSNYSLFVYMYIYIPPYISESVDSL